MTHCLSFKCKLEITGCYGLGCRLMEGIIPEACNTCEIRSDNVIECKHCKSYPCNTPPRYIVFDGTEEDKR